MTATTAYIPAVAPRDLWEQARAKVAELEQVEAEARDRATAARRAMPAVRIDHEYEFTDASGLLRLRDLFQGRRQLILYHFMYAPEWSEGCSHCTQFAEGISPGAVHALAEGGATLALVSRAPFDRLDAWRSSHAWQIPWFSMDDRFARDFGSLLDDGDRPMVSVFVRDGDEVLHSFQAGGREVELVMPAQRWLDFTPSDDDVHPHRS